MDDYKEESGGILDMVSGHELLTKREKETFIFEHKKRMA
jgi:hypothetical protein